MRGGRYPTVLRYKRRRIGKHYQVVNSRLIYQQLSFKIFFLSHSANPCRHPIFRGTFIDQCCRNGYRCLRGIQCRLQQRVALYHWPDGVDNELLQRCVAGVVLHWKRYSRSEIVDALSNGQPFIRRILMAPKNTSRVCSTPTLNPLQNRIRK